MPQITFFQHVKILIVALLFSLAIPILFLLCFLPIIILRYITSLLKRLLRPNFGKLLSARSCVFATDGIWSNPKCSIVNFMTIEGSPKVEWLRTNFKSRILQGDAKSKCPELLQFPSTFLGFPVWIPEANFSVERHVNNYNGPITFDLFDEQVLLSILKELTWREYIQFRSPWDVYLIPNYIVQDDPDPQVPKTIIIFRVHHCLADGIGLTSLLRAFMEEDDLSLPKPNYPKRSMLSSCIYMLACFIRVPYDLAAKSILHYDPIGVWNLPEKQLSRNVGLGFTKQIPMAYLKKIRNPLKVSTTGVIMAVIAGAMRRIMIESGKGVPKYITMLTALPMKGHPEKLRNHMTIGFIPLPVGTDDPLERLHIIEGAMTSLRRSTAPMTMFLFGTAAGCLYPKMTRMVSTKAGISLILSNFPGPASSEGRFLNHPVVNSFTLGGAIGIGMGIGSFSAKGQLRMLIGINEEILNDSATYAKRFAEYVLLELDVLAIAGGEV